MNSRAPGADTSIWRSTNHARHLGQGKFPPWCRPWWSPIVFCPHRNAPVSRRYSPCTLQLWIASNSLTVCCGRPSRKGIDDVFHLTTNIFEYLVHAQENKNQGLFQLVQAFGETASFRHMAENMTVHIVQGYRLVAKEIEFLHHRRSDYLPIRESSVDMFPMAHSFNWSSTIQYIAITLSWSILGCFWSPHLQITNSSYYFFLGNSGYLI